MFRRWLIVVLAVALMGSASTPLWANPGDTLVVNSTDDTFDGACNAAHCSLREAIIEANARAGPDTVIFALGLIDGPVIKVNEGGLGPLPVIVDTLTIDGTSHLTGPVILDGRLTEPGTIGLRLVAGGSVLRGLTITQFNSNGMEIEGGGSSIIAGNSIVANVGSGILILDSPGNIIGGGGPEGRNIITRNGVNGIELRGRGATANVVAGNIIGPSSLGETGNGGVGILVLNAPRNIIGGGAGNVITGNGEQGLFILGADATENTITSNVIGADATATLALPNGDDGIYIRNAGGNAIGGVTANDRNIIVANQGDGIHIFGGEAGNRVVGNMVGLSPADVAGLGNLGFGVLIEEAGGNQIGGSEAGAGNSIAYNVAGGARVLSGVRNTIRRNLIFGNGGLAIDLGPLGPTANDLLDEDRGANELQNSPVISSAVMSGTELIVEGFLDSTPGERFTIDLYVGAGCEGPTAGGSQAYLGSAEVTSDGKGLARFRLNYPIGGGIIDVVNATATDAAGNTSEFSACTQVVLQPQLEVTGRVLLQGRSNHAGTRVEVGPLTTTTEPDGTFRVSLLPGEYQVTAIRRGYLSARTTIQLVQSHLTLPLTVLPGGDAIANQRIGIEDLVIIEANYGSEPPGDPRGDINEDGRIDLIDATMVGVNYGRQGFQPWGPGGQRASVGKAEARVTLDQPRQVAAGETFEVGLRASGTAGLDLAVRFDPSRLTLLSAESRAPWHVLRQSRDATKGRLSLAAVRLADTALTDGAVLTLRFQAQTSGGPGVTLGGTLTDMEGRSAHLQE